MSQRFLLKTNTKYSPESQSDRLTLGDKLIGNLMANFMLPYNIAGTEELVFKKDGFENTQVSLLCYTSVAKNSYGEYEARRIGEDAIRVVGVYQASDSYTRYLARAHSRVNRTGTIEGIVERTLTRIEEVSRMCESPPCCPNCGAPAFLSKAGREVCAELCWKRR